MRALITVLALFALSAVNFVNGQAPVTTANPNASPAARAVLSYLYDLPNRADNRVIAGQFGFYGSQEDYGYAQASLQRVFDQTGQWPALTGADYANDNGIPEANRYLIDKWNEGMLVTLSWHSPNPCTGGSAGSTPGNNFDLKRVLTGGNCHAAWLTMLDAIAGGLQELENAGVVVIWRPFHEQNGPWFWFGGGRPAEFVQLWRHMFDYFTTTKGLDNLLWAFSPNHQWDQYAPPVLTYYPGAAYVDIVGMDKYMGCTKRSGNDAQIASREETLDIRTSYNDLLTTGKPIGLLEFGILPASGACWKVNPYPYTWEQFIGELRTSYPRIVMFQAWEYIWQLGADRYRGLPALMSDSWVVGRAELPDFRTGGVIVLPTPSPTILPPTVTWLPSPTPPPFVATNTPVPPTPAPTATPPPLACVERVERYVNGVQVAVFVRAC